MYKQRNRRVEALQWTGDNLAEVIALCGQDNVRSSGARVQVVSSAENMWRELTLGMWITKDLNDGYTCLHSGTAFERFWQPADD